MWIILVLVVIAFAIGLAKAANSGFDVQRDDFRKTVWIYSNRKQGSSAIGLQSGLRAFFVDGQLGRVQLYCVSREKDWRFYESATGEDGVDLEFVSVDSDVTSATVKIGGVVDTVEKFAINIPVDYLEQMVVRDWKIKLYGKRGQEVTTVKKKAAEEFLDLIRKAEQDPSCLTDGSIKGSGIGKLAMTVGGIIVAFFVLVVYLGVTHKNRDANSETAPPQEQAVVVAPEAKTAVVERPMPSAYAPGSRPALDEFFLGMEKGCQISEAAKELPPLVNFDEEDREKYSANSQLKKQYPNIFLEDPEIYDDGGSVSATVRVNAEFHGVPVSEIVRVYGKENGVSVFMLTLDDGRAEEKLRKVMSFSSVMSEASGEYIAPAFETDGKQTKLTCDLSM